MNASSLINLDGTLVTVTEGDPDAHNNPTEDTDEADVKCWYEQRDATETGADGAFDVETHRLFFRAGTTVTAADRLEVNGHEFAILGSPWEAVHPVTAQVSHIEAKGRQTK